MKKYLTLSLSLLACALLASCGAPKKPESAWMGIGPGSDLEAVTQRTEYWDLTVESETLFQLGLWEQNPEQYNAALLRDNETVYAPLGTQFAGEAPVQIWSELTSGGARVCLYGTDGDGKPVLEGISRDYASIDSNFQCYMDREQNCYFYRTDYSRTDGEYRYVGTIVKIHPSGEILYQTTLEPGFTIKDICQTKDGSIFLLLLDYEHYTARLAQLNPENGQLLPGAQMDLPYGMQCLGTGEGSLAAAGLGNGGYSIEAVDMAQKTTSPLLYLSGTSYGWHGDSILQDFRVLEDGSMELLWTDRDGLGCFQDRLRMEKVEKTPIVLRGIFFADDWLPEQISLFNQQSSEYHVILESCGYGNDLEDFARLTSVQVGAGKGPDILCGSNLLSGSLDGMLDKGALEALNPYMEASGIREEDYFPLVFSSWRQGETIYGVTPKMEVTYEEMDTAVLESSQAPDIETLADALLAREGNEIYRERLSSGQLLNSFLQGSETLWGMVDWEAGSCNFNVPLFGKLLEAARRFGYDTQKALEPQITYDKNLNNFFGFHSSEEQEAMGRTAAGTLFDDGCHAVSLPLYTMAVNANSTCKEGAWDFLSFLLSEEVQYRERWYLPPVHRSAFDRWLKWEIEDGSAVRYENGHMVHPIYYGENISEEKQAEYKKAIEDARPLPIRTAPILAIVLDEAEDYFNGSKSAEEVGLVAGSRVQLYLSERQ